MDVAALLRAHHARHSGTAPACQCSHPLADETSEDPDRCVMCGRLTDPEKERLALAVALARENTPI